LSNVAVIDILNLDARGIPAKRSDIATTGIKALNVLREESIRRVLDCDTFVAIFNGDVMHIVIVSRDIKPISFPNMVRNNLHVMCDIVVPNDRHMI